MPGQQGLVGIGVERQAQATGPLADGLQADGRADQQAGLGIDAAGGQAGGIRDRFARSGSG